MSFIGVFRRRSRLAPRGLVWRLLALWALAPLALPAAEPLQTHNIEQVSELTTGSTQAVAIYDHYALVGQGASLRVLDIQDADHPAPAGALDLGNAQARQIAIDGQRAYVATDDPVDRYGLIVVDLTDPAHPARLGAWQMAEGSYLLSATDIAVEGNRVFLGSQYTSHPLAIIDVSHPGQPVEDPPSPAHNASGIAVNKGWIYFAESGGLSIVDATRPGETPVFAKWLQNDDLSFSDIRISGNLAYGVRYDGKLTVLDLTDPINPTIKGSVIAPQSPISQATNNHLAIAKSFAWVSNELGCWLVDVNDPTAPRVRGSVAYAGQPVGRLALVGDRACLAEPNGLQWFLASDLDHPALAGRFDIGIYRPGEIAMRGAWAWVVTRGVCWAVDLTDPAHPKMAGHCPLAGQGQRIALNATGTWACVLSGATGVQTINLTDPAHPTLLASFKLPNPGQVGNLAMKGNFAFIQANASSDQPPQPARLYVYDLSDPARPVLLCTNELLGDLSALAVGGDLLYGFRPTNPYSSYRYVSIIDISDPAQPVERGAYPNPATSSSFYPMALTTDDTGLYLLDDQLNVMAPAGPTGLKIEGQMKRSFGAGPGNYLKAGQGRLAFNMVSELRLFDVRDQANLRLVGTWYGMNYNNQSFAMQDDLIVNSGSSDYYSDDLRLVVLRYHPSDMIQVISPAGDEIIPVGAPVTVHWKSDPTTAGAAVRIELWRAYNSDSPTTPQLVSDLGTFDAPNGEGSREITLPLKYQGLFKIRVVDAAAPAIYGESLDPFMIQASGNVRIIAPSGACVWPADSVQQLDWESDPLNAPGSLYKFELWRGPIKVDDLGSGPSLNGAGSLSWKVPYYLPPGPGYWIKPPGTTATAATTHMITITNDHYTPWNAIHGANWALYD